MLTSKKQIIQKLKQTPPQRRHRKRLIAIIILFVVVIGLLITIIVIRKQLQSSRLPESMNMSTPMNMQNMSAATSIDKLKMSPSDAPVKNFTLVAQVIKRPGLPDQWTFNGTVPSPEIRVTQGDHVHITLVNHLPIATSIHWHGVSVPNAEDGVAGVTQDAVKPGQLYTYDFIASDSGTYWYHSHQDTSNQVPKGLFGAFIVEPQKHEKYDHDYTLIYHDANPKLSTFIWGLIKQRLGLPPEKLIDVNGKQNEYLSAKPGETVKLRIVDAFEGYMSGDPIRIVPFGVPFKIVALDGHDINKPQELQPHILPVGEGERYDITFTVPQSGTVRLFDTDNSETVTVGGGDIQQPTNLKNLPTFDLIQYGHQIIDPIMKRQKFDANYNIILGVHPGFRNGSIELVHTMNGKAFPNIPMIAVKPGQVVHIHFDNKTDEYHPMHLHGHYFTVLKENGKAVTGSPIHQDSVVVNPHQTMDVAFVANNPGLWMLHCHILIHAVFGMDMMVVYPNISTPYSVGEKSGNIPE